ncbi:MAG: hypothetical protein RLZZ455_195 [Candidatus Parcubacteria bacterium]|jgi:GT2 family glycosyltransferase
MKRLVIELKKRDLTNLYKPTSTHRIEYYDEVVVRKGFHFEYAEVFLKEWFFLSKPGGTLTIFYQFREENSDKLEKLLWWLFRGNYTIERHEQSSRRGILVVRKLRSQFIPGDSIDKWTFGIITNGERDDWMDEIIASIRALNIPEYEIIVCGKYKERNEKNFRYIAFNERAERGWITKKKNLICNVARYENLCILHDRLVFEKDWFKGMRKFGNAFELLGCVQRDFETGIRAGDWLTHGGKIHERYKISRLEYTDWDFALYLSGQLTIIKKSIWEKVLWDETKYWGEEDVDFSFRARDMGYLIRFNPFSSVTAKTWRHGNLPLRYKRSEGILPKDMFLRRIMRIAARILFSVSIIDTFAHRSLSGVLKSRVYKHFIYH